MTIFDGYFREGSLRMVDTVQLVLTTKMHIISLSKQYLKISNGRINCFIEPLTHESFIVIIYLQVVFFPFAVKVGSRAITTFLFVVLLFFFTLYHLFCVAVVFLFFETIFHIFFLVIVLPSVLVHTDSHPFSIKLLPLVILTKI